jgi:hypothetical protein
MKCVDSDTYLEDALIYGIETVMPKRFDNAQNSLHIPVLSRVLDMDKQELSSRVW